MKAITIGSAMVDIITIVADSDVERMTMHNATSSFLLLEQGRKIDAESISIHIGGGAINTAVCLSRLGCDAGCFVKIGKDINGQRIIDRLTEEKVSAEHVINSSEDSTGTAVMISSHDRNATIFTQRGVNRLLRCDEIQSEIFEGMDLVYVSSLSNESADCFPQIVKQADEAGAFVATNPGIRQLTSRTDAFFESLGHVHLLNLNRVEAAALIPGIFARLGDLNRVQIGNLTDDSPELVRTGLSFGGFSISLATLFDAIITLGPKYFNLTNGSEGAYLSDGKKIVYASAPAIEPQGTAGAGDAFASTLSLLLADNEPFERALRAASVNASHVVKVIDTQSGLLNRKVLDAEIQNIGTDIAVREFDISSIT